MRSVGCIVNDIFDRNIDKKVDRTKLRPLASSQITLTKAIILLLILSAIGFCVLINLNPPAVMNWAIKNLLLLVDAPSLDQ